MDMTKAVFNEERFLNSDFTEKFIELVGKYQKTVGAGSPETIEASKKDAKAWIDDKRDYCVRYFLQVSAYEDQLPFSMHDITKMSIEEFFAIRKRAEEVCSILDEKKALFEEFLTFYDEP